MRDVRAADMPGQVGQSRLLRGNRSGYCEASYHWGMGCGLIEEILQDIRKGGKSRAVVAFGASFPDAAIGNLSQLQNGFGAADVAVDELCIHVPVNPWNLLKMNGKSDEPGQ